jgi:hypothetical protein
VCDSSLFRYIDSVDNRIDTLDNQMMILGDSTINGKRFKKISGFATFNTGLFANCDGGDYRLLFPLSALGLNVDSVVNEILGGLPIPIPPNMLNIPKTVQTSVLKTNLPVNSTWTDSIFTVALPPFFSLVAGLEYRIIAKGIQYTVLQKTYNNVIHVKSDLKVVSALFNLPLDFSIDYFFARDVGIIEVQVRNAGILQRTLKLYSYNL